MRLILLLLILLLSACAPIFYGDSIELSEEELRSSENPVWVAEMQPALQTTAVTLKAFDPAITEVTAKEVGSDTQRFKIRELESAWLEKQRVMVLLAFQYGRAVLLVLNLENRSGALEEGTVAARLRLALLEAMDAKFQRGQL